MPTDVEVCNRALQLAGAQNTITALNGAENEAIQCNLIFEEIRNRVNGIAHWGFARKTLLMRMVKAAPGTPQSTLTAAASWKPSYPAPPWLYAYQYPTDCLFFQYLLGQGVTLGTPPIFSTPQASYFLNQFGPPQRFCKATDGVPPIASIVNITRANPAAVETSSAHGFSTGNTIWINGVIGMTQINNQNYTITSTGATSFTLGINSSNYTAYDSQGTAVNLSGAESQASVINTMASAAIGVYTMKQTTLNLWDEEAIRALVNALAGYLAIPLSGDRALAKDLFVLANDTIIQARAKDANEGFTIQQTMPDWLAARWGEQVNDGYGDGGYLTSPYPALFAVA